MTEQSHENNKDFQPQSPEKNSGDDLNLGYKYLSNAFKVSFAVLKFIMIVLIALFLLSGFETVGSDEQALVLRFGKIRGIGERRVLGPGLKWVFPYPIEEIVKIPVAKKVNLPINSFWYFQTEQEMLGQSPKTRTRIPEALNPIRDGYCITRSEKQTQTIAGSDGSDYNIVHSRWQVTYQIDDPERFFKNTYVQYIKPGESYYDVITMSVTPLLENLADDAIVTAMVNYTIDEAIKSQDRIPKHVKRLLQEKLNKIESGIKVVSVQLTDIIWPRQVDEAFWASIRVSQESQKAISQAKGYAESTINETAGPVALELLAALEDKTISEETKELLWSQLAGAAQEKIAQARAYRTKIAETARANAEYFQKLLPEYRKRPKLVIQKIYQDAIEYVLNNADEKFIIQPAKGAKGREFWLQLSRDPTIKPKSEK
jgi:membrane protease subunit HflK